MYISYVADCLQIIEKKCHFYHLSRSFPPLATDTRYIIDNPRPSSQYWCDCNHHNLFFLGHIFQLYHWQLHNPHQKWVNSSNNDLPQLELTLLLVLLLFLFWRLHVVVVKDHVLVVKATCYCCEGFMLLLERLYVDVKASCCCCEGFMLLLGRLHVVVVKASCYCEGFMLLLWGLHVAVVKASCCCEGFMLLWRLRIVVKATCCCCESFKLLWRLHVVVVKASCCCCEDFILLLWRLHVVVKASCCFLKASCCCCEGFMLLLWRLYVVVVKASCCWCCGGFMLLLLWRLHSVLEGFTFFQVSCCHCCCHTYCCYHCYCYRSTNIRVQFLVECKMFEYFCSDQLLILQSGLLLWLGMTWSLSTSTLSMYTTVVDHGYKMYENSLFGSACFCVVGGGAVRSCGEGGNVGAGGRGDHGESGDSSVGGDGGGEWNVVFIMMV